MALSPDLGSIEVSAVVPPAHAKAPDILGQLGTEAGQLIGNAINQKRLNDADDAFNDIADEQLGAGAVEEDSAEFVGPPTSRGDAVTEQLGIIRTLQAGVNQATGSRKAALELELRGKVEELGNKNPKLRQAYAQELGRFMRVDPEVQAIGMLDVGDANYSASAAKDLERIKSHATGSVASGGLGMSPGLKFGDRAWVQEFLYRQGKRDVSANNQLTLQSLQAGEQLDARASADNFQSSMVGVSNNVSAGLEQAMDMTTRVGKALRDPTQPGAAETISEWNNFGRQAVLQDLNRAVFGIEEAFAAIPVNQAHTDAYQAAKALRNDRVAALGVLIEGVTNDDHNIIRAHEAYEVQQKINFERKNPQFVDDVRNLQPLVKIMDVVGDEFGREGALIRNELAKTVNQGIEAVLGRSIAKTSHDDLPPNATPAELAAHYRGIRTDTDNMYDTGDTSARANRSHASTDISLKSRDSYLQMASKGAVTPRIAADQVGSMAADIDQLLTSGQAEGDALAQAVVDISNPGWLEMGKIAQQSSQPAAAVLFGEKIQDLAFQYEPVRLATYNELRTTQVADSVFAAQVISVDDTNISKGEVVFRVNEDLIRETIKNDPRNASRFTADRFGSSLEQDVAVATRKANETAAALTKQVSSDLRAYAHGSALTQGLTIPGYAAEWERNRFSEFFGELPSAEEQ